MSNAQGPNTNLPCSDCLESTRNKEDSSGSYSSLSSQFADISKEYRSALDEFRADWQKELQEKNNCSNDVFDQNTKKKKKIGYVNNTRETLAINLYRTAVDLEQKGKVYDALPFYRKAVQIEPNIEFKYYDDYQKGIIQKDESIKIFKSTKQNKENSLVVYENLYDKFRLDLSSNIYEGKLMRNNYERTTIKTTELHISDLPPEIISYILRWVISNQLDMRSLEQCAAVCKGLYLCARDDELWRLACVKVWGSSISTLKEHNEVINKNSTVTVWNEIKENLKSSPTYFNTWRQMFTERERVLFNGCYISKTTYLRMGENSFQDQYYRPIQLVEYYRYLRFLTDGTVLMMTTADEPAQAVGRLKNINYLRADILKGKYYLHDNILSVVLNKLQSQQHQQQTSTARATNNTSSTTYSNRYRRNSNTFNDISTNNTKYFLKFHILNAGKRKFSQLKWIHYSIVQVRNKHEITSEFEMTPSKYPSLWFSIVRSYHLHTESPLV